jgi:hypothetical protein
MVAFANGEPFFLIDTYYEEETAWLICKHFKTTNDVIRYYQNLNSLIITNGVILCGKCYQKIQKGNAKEVIDSCLEVTDDGYSEIFSLGIYVANKNLLNIFKNRLKYYKMTKERSL